MIRRLLCGLFGHDWRLAGARDLLRGRAGDLCVNCGLVRWERHRVGTLAVQKLSVSIPMNHVLADEFTYPACKWCGGHLTKPRRGRFPTFCSGRCRVAHFREEHRPL